MIIITGFVKKEVEEFDMGIPSIKNNHPMKYDEDDKSNHLGNCIFYFVFVTICIAILHRSGSGSKIKKNVQDV